MKAPHPTDLRDAAIIRSAAHFSACVFLGRGRYERADDLPTLAAAKAAGAALEARFGKRAMIYGVSAEGRAAMVTPITEELAYGA